MNVLAYWHQPRFSSGEHGNNAAYQPFWQDLYDAGADIVLNGHDHDYERFAPQGPTGVADPGHGVREFVVGTGGAENRAFASTIVANSEARATGTFGVLELTLGPSSYTWQFLPVAGATFTDAGEGSPHGPPSNTPTAAFTASATTVATGTAVQFTDSSGNAASWSWDFGDGTTSTAQNPTHTWGVAGTYKVSLVAGNNGGLSTAATMTMTITPGVDTQPPTDATAFTATANGATAIDLAWVASIDNVGVAACDIYRDGSSTPLASVSGGASAYRDTGLAASTTYSYTIQCRDAAGNRSNVVGPVSATTAAAGTAMSVILAPVADTFADTSTPTVNTGTQLTIRVDASPVVHTYLKFDLTGLSGTVTKATLRIYGKSTSSSGYLVGSTATTWTETGLTAANAPPIGASVGGSGPIPTGTWTSVDVSSLVTTGGPVAFGLSGISTTSVSMASRESGATAPQLVLEITQ
jgi:PKD repeat protein